MPFFFLNPSISSEISISELDKFKALVDYKGSTKFFFKFESLPPEDHISGRRATLAGDISSYPYLTEGAFGSGLRLRPKGYITYPQSLPDSLKEFSMGFWLRPTNIKPVLNSSTGLVNNYHLSLIDKANFAVSGSNSQISAITSDTTFVMFEECLEMGQNRLKILLNDGWSESILATEPYLADQMHYFWISYHGETGRFDVRIDGLLSHVSFISGNTLPTSLLSNPSVPFHINKAAIGYAGLCRGNSCLIDELIFQTEYVSDTNTISRHINLGSEYVLDETLAHREEVLHAFAFDDQTTIGVTALYTNGSKIYVGRENGQVLKGDRTMWKTVRDFSNRAEIFQIKQQILATGGMVNIENGALKIVNASARI